MFFGEGRAWGGTPRDDNLADVMLYRAGGDLGSMG